MSSKPPYLLNDVKKAFFQAKTFNKDLDESRRFVPSSEKIIVEIRKEKYNKLQWKILFINGVKDIVDSVILNEYPSKKVIHKILAERCLKRAFQKEMLQ